jgi:hypothetical protein
VRVIWLVLAACSSTAATPPAAPSVTTAPPPPTATPTVAAAAPGGTLRARVGIDRGSWTDIIVDGSEAHARHFCARLVKDAQLGLGGVTLRVMRECSTDKLPPAPIRGVHLVETTSVDDNSFLLGDLLERPQPAPGAVASPPLRGMTVHVLPFGDRLKCEAMRLQLEAEDQQRDLDSHQREMQDIDRKLPQVIEAEAQVCAELDRVNARCTKLRGERRTECLLEAGPRTIECNRQKRERAALEERRARPPRRVDANRTCRAL